MPASWYVGSDWTARIAPKQHNPLAFRWQDQPIEIRSILLSEINEGRGLSLLIDIGETMDNGLFKVPIYTYRNSSLPNRSPELATSPSQHQFPEPP